MPPGELYDLVDRFRGELLRRERTAASAMVREYGKAWQAIQDRLNTLTRQYYDLVQKGATPPVSWLYENQRLQVLRAQVEDEIRDFASFAESSILSTQRDAVEAAQLHADALMQAALPDGIKLDFNRLPRQAFENLVGFLQDGTPLRDLLNELPGQAGQTAADTLTRGLALGLNPVQIGRQMRMALGGNLARALRIARTETLRAYREATRQSYLANSNVVSGWIWRSARNERTCAACWALDGTEHTLEERLDDHICGRCFAIPKIKSWKELGFAGIEEPSSVISDTGPDAFEKLPAAQQLQVLGPAKFAAWKDGRITLPDLVGRKFDSRWGWMRYEKSLTEVLGREQAKAYTRLALMGVAKSAGNYSADDLIRIAGLGLRDLTPGELSRVVQHVAGAGFDPQATSIVKHDLAGLFWKRKQLQVGDVIPTGEVHFLKHVLVQHEWSAGTTLDNYLNSLRTVILDPKSGIMISKYQRSYWQIAFIGKSGAFRGPEGYDHILLEYRTKFRYWVTGFQPENLAAQLLKDREAVKWLRELTT